MQLYKICSPKFSNWFAALRSRAPNRPYWIFGRFFSICQIETVKFHLFTRKIAFIWCCPIENSQWHLFAFQWVGYRLGRVICFSFIQFVDLSHNSSWKHKYKLGSLTQMRNATHMLPHTIHKRTNDTNRFSTSCMCQATECGQMKNERLGIVSIQLREESRMQERIQEQ